MKQKSAQLRRGRFQVLLINGKIPRLVSKLSLQGFSKLLEPEVTIARIVPFVRDLCQDSSQHVRAALANQITGLAPLLGHGPTIEHLLQLFLHLLKDEFPEVRLNIISKLEQVNEGTFFSTLTSQPRIYLILCSTQLLVFNYWQTTSYQLSLSLLRISPGEYDKLSSSIYRCWPPNLAGHSLMNNSQICACHG